MVAATGFCSTFGAGDSAGTAAGALAEPAGAAIAGAPTAFCGCAGAITAGSFARGRAINCAGFAFGAACWSPSHSIKASIARKIAQIDFLRRGVAQSGPP